MRRGIWRPDAAVRLAVLLAMHRATWVASLMLTTIGAYVVAPSALAAGQASQSGTAINGRAAVGALFTTSNGRPGTHFCTASVVNSPRGDLLITAAHCLEGKSLNPAGSVVFAPGYHDGKFPHGTWVVTTEFVDAAWAQNQDPDDDVAFLVVGRKGTHIQRHTGADTLKIGAPAQVVEAIGYPDQTEEPITCTVSAHVFNPHEMVFDCDNYTNGTSGGPLLARVDRKTGEGWIIGVIGGYELGGDSSNVSYSPMFSSAILALYNTAVAAS